MRRFFVLAVVLTASAGQAIANDLTYLDLIGRLTDLERLAVLPDPGETCAQWSSYDRASTWDAATGEYVKWEANGDGNGFIRQEGTSQVLAEMEGPGCIWRIWSAMPQEGPRQDLPRWRGNPRHRPALHRPTSTTRIPRSTARPSSTCTRPRPELLRPHPIPEVLQDRRRRRLGRYYQFTYATFPKGTTVPTFTQMLLPPKTPAALDEANAILTSGGLDPWGKERAKAAASRPRRPSSRRASNCRCRSKPARTRRDRPSPRSPSRPTSPTSEDRSDVLRELVLADHMGRRSITRRLVPLGDFFGTAPGENLYRSFPSGMTESGYLLQLVHAIRQERQDRDPQRRRQAAYGRT